MGDKRLYGLDPNNITPSMIGGRVGMMLQKQIMILRRLWRRSCSKPQRPRPTEIGNPTSVNTLYEAVVMVISNEKGGWPTKGDHIRETDKTVALDRDDAGLDKGCEIYHWR